MVNWLQSISHHLECDSKSEICGLASTVTAKSLVYFGTSCMNCISDAGKRDVPVLI